MKINPAIGRVFAFMVSTKVTFESRKAKKFFDDAHNAAIDKALPAAQNRTINKLKTRVKRRISQRTGVSQKAIQDLIIISKASRYRREASLTIRSKTPNAIRFGAKETKRHLSVRAFRKTQRITTGFIGNSGRTAFKREPGTKRLPIRSVYGPNVARAFGAEKNMRVFQRYARFVMPVEFDRAAKFYLSKI